jgi:hypothetical protein
MRHYSVGEREDDQLLSKISFPSGDEWERGGPASFSTWPCPTVPYVACTVEIRKYETIEHESVLIIPIFS